MKSFDYYYSVSYVSGELYRNICGNILGYLQQNIIFSLILFQNECVKHFQGSSEIEAKQGKEVTKTTVEAKCFHQVEVLCFQSKDTAEKEE